MHNRQKHYLLSIPEPCIQDWEQMTPEAQGRHCAMCNRVIQDYTSLTDTELIALMQAGSLHCGRFRKNQLDRSILPERGRPKRSLLFEKAAAAFLFFSTAWNQLSAAKPSDTQIVVTGIKSDTTNHSTPTADSTIAIQGAVYDRGSNTPVAGATICISDTNFTCMTNEKGEFEFLLPASWLEREVNISPTEAQKTKDNTEGARIIDTTLHIDKLAFAGPISIYRDTTNLLPAAEIVSTRVTQTITTVLGMVAQVVEDPHVKRKRSKLLLLFRKRHSQDYFNKPRKK